MLGRYTVRQSSPYGIGATNVEIANRIRWGGFSVAGIALTIAAVAFLWPVIKIERARRKIKKRYKKAKSAITGNPYPFGRGLRGMDKTSYKLKVISEALGKPMTETTREVIDYVYDMLDLEVREKAAKKVGKKK
jgi:hypothetical protein